MENSMNKLVCLSDSVASSFKLKVRANSFGDLLSRRLSLDYCLHSLCGATSGEHLRALNEDAQIIEEIKQAKIVVLVTGSNNITMTYLVVMANAVGIPFNGRMIASIIDALKENPLKAAKILKAMNSSETKAAIQAGVDDFKREMPLIFARIRELNPEAIIVVQTVFCLGDTTKNPVYKTMSRGQVGYIEQMNRWSRENSDKYDYVLSDLAKALKEYRGNEDLTNVKDKDIHLTDLGHLLAYRMLYDAITEKYPQFKCEEAPDVIRVRKIMTREERLAREKNDNAIASSKYAGIVKSAIYEIAGKDDFEIDMNKQFMNMGMNENDVLEIAKVLERELFDGKPTFVVSNMDFGCRVTPMYFIDVLEGRYPDSVLKHMDLLTRYTSAQEKAEAEQNDTEGLRIIKSGIRELLQDDMAVISPDMTFYGDLHFNFDDLAETSRFAENRLKDTRLEATRRPNPETITVGEVGAYIDAIL